MLLHLDFNIISIKLYILILFILFISLILTHTSRIFFSKKLINICGIFIDIPIFIYFNIYLLCIISYFIFCVAFFYNNKDDLLDYLGIWLSIQLSIIFFPVTRNSFLIYFFKISHSTMVNTHKFISYIFCISVIIKFIIVMIIYENSFIIQLQNTSNNGSPLSGTLSFIMNICILIFSNSYIRNKWYELFLYSHKIFVTLILTGAFFHLTTTVYYMIPSLTLYIIDVIIRFCRIKKSKYSSITILEENNVNKYIILKLILNKNVKITNSYYMICIKNISSSEWHPFSLLEQHNNTYVFCAKIIDDDKSWTGKINNKTIKDDIYIQGPYLYFENINFNIYNNIICITSGTGIIPILHKLKELNKIKINKKLDNLNNIILIWVSKDTCLVKYLLDYIIQLNHSYIKISIYITEPINFIGYDSSFIKYKRPNIKDIFKKFNIKKSKLCSQPKMAVLACGNDNLINDVKIQSNIYGLDFYNEKH